MATFQTLSYSIANMNVWRKGDARAPHKPLLLLYVLSQYQHGHGRLFDYGSEIDATLHSLLERFGPARREYRPDMPFWRLKGDGFWAFENADIFLEQGVKQLKRGELIDNRVAGGFDEEHFRLLEKHPSYINRLAHQILNEHFPESVQEVIADEMGFDFTELLKTRDPKFRQLVLRAYNYQCAICGFNLRLDNTPVGIEAAHIKWKQYGGPCEVHNGLALCSLHHKAFDMGSIGLDEEMRVLISEGVNGNGMVQMLLRDFAGRKLMEPVNKDYLPDLGFVKWHREQVFSG